MPQDQTPLPSPGRVTEPATPVHAPGAPAPRRGTNQSFGPRGWLALGLTLAAMAAVLAGELAGLPFANWLHDMGRLSLSDPRIWGLPWASFPRALGNLGRILGNPWEFPGEAALGFIFGAIELAGIFALGYFMLSRRAWRRMLPLPAERLALALPVGAVPFSLAVLGLGLAGLARNETIIILVILAVIAGGIGAGRMLRHDLLSTRETLRRGWPRPRMLAGLAVAVFLIAIPYALAPAVESDELRYHLAAPATWLREGRIHYLPYQAFSNFPMLGEMLFMAAMALGETPAAKLTHLAFLPVCMGLVAMIALRLMRPRNHSNAAGAGLAFALMPAVPVLAAWGFIDIFVTAYFLAFVYVAGRALARPGRAAGTLVGLLMAGGLGTKYTMAPLLVALGAVWAALMAARVVKKEMAGGRWMRLVMATALVAALFGGGWFVKNAIWTGNPVYPLTWGVFHGGEWSVENAKFYVDKAHSKGMHLAAPAGWPTRGLAGQAVALGTRLVEFLITPVTTEFHFNRFEESYLGPLPLLAVIIWLGGLAAGWSRRSRLKPRAAGRLFHAWVNLALLVSWLGWFLTYQSNRMLLPTVGLGLALGAAALARWERATPRWAGRAMRALLAVAAVGSFAFLFTNFFTPSSPPGQENAAGWAVGLGFDRPESYLSRKLAYWRPAQWLGRHAHPGERAWLVGEHRTLYFDLPVLASDWFDTPQPLAWIRRTRTNDELLDGLRAAGVRYIFFNAGELGKYYRDFFAPRFRPEELRRFEDLWNNPRLRVIHEEGEGPRRVIVFEILGPREGDK